MGRSGFGFPFLLPVPSWLEAVNRILSNQLTSSSPGQIYPRDGCGQTRICAWSLPKVFLFVQAPLEGGASLEKGPALQCHGLADGNQISLAMWVSFYCKKIRLRAVRQQRAIDSRWARWQVSRVEYAQGPGAEKLKVGCVLLPPEPARPRRLATRSRTGLASTCRRTPRGLRLRARVEVFRVCVCWSFDILQQRAPRARAPSAPAFAAPATFRLIGRRITPCVQDASDVLCGPLVYRRA